MGVYIENIEMPKDEEMLCVNIYPDGKVCINLDLECKRIATAVSVPPHGRSIDADELLTLCRDYAITPDDDEFCKRLEYALNKAPTIIPASEETED